MKGLYFIGLIFKALTGEDAVGLQEKYAFALIYQHNFLIKLINASRKELVTFIIIITVQLSNFINYIMQIKQMNLTSY